MFGKLKLKAEEQTRKLWAVKSIQFLWLENSVFPYCSRHANTQSMNPRKEDYWPAVWERVSTFHL